MLVNGRNVPIFLYIEMGVNKEADLDLRAKSSSWAGLWYLYPSEDLTINFSVPHLWNRVILLPCTPEVLWQCIKKIERYSYTRAMKATHLLKIAHWLTTIRKEIPTTSTRDHQPHINFLGKYRSGKGPSEIPHHITCRPPLSRGSSDPDSIEDENRPA